MIDSIPQETTNNDKLKQHRLPTKNLYIDNDRWKELNIDLKRVSNFRIDHFLRYIVILQCLLF